MLVRWAVDSWTVPVILTLATVLVAWLGVLLVRPTRRDIFRDSFYYTVLSLVLAGVGAACGFAIPLVFLGPSGIPAGAAGAVLGWAVGVSLARGEINARERWRGVARRAIERRPEARQRSRLVRFLSWLADR